MKRYTITTNSLPMDIMDMHLTKALEYIKQNNLEIIKIEEHIKDERYPNVVKEMKLVDLNDLLAN